MKFCKDCRHVKGTKRLFGIDYHHATCTLATSKFSPSLVTGIASDVEMPCELERNYGSCGRDGENWEPIA